MSEAYAGEVAGAVGGDIPEQVRDHALREIISLNLVVDGQLLHFGYQAPVPTDNPLEKAVMTKVIEASLLSIPLTGGVNKGQILRLAAASGARFRDRNKQVLKCHRYPFRKADPDEASRRDRVAVPDQADSFCGRHDLTSFRRVHGG